MKSLAAYACVGIAILAFDGQMPSGHVRADDTATPPPAAASSPASSKAPTPAPPDERDRRARALVEVLAHSDPALRAMATEKLLALGSDARRAIFDATKSDNPELRAIASDLLNKLPWFLPDDSPNIRILLANYGTLNVEQRRDVIEKLAENRAHGFDAMFRLIQEEPSDDVKWAIATEVRQCFRPEVLTQFRTLPTNDPLTPAPQLAAAGHAMFVKDQEAAAKLFRRAIDVELDRPANDNGELGYAFDRLQFVHHVNERYAKMAEVARLRAARSTPEEGDVPAGVLELFTLHAKFGPLPGFEKDLTTYQNGMNDERVMYCLAKVFDRSGQRFLAAATQQGAFMGGLVSGETRRKTGEFLFLQSWYEPAMAEWSARLGVDGDLNDLERGEIHHRLYKAAAARDQDALAAEHLTQCVDLIHKAGRSFTGPGDIAMAQEISWHSLRAAQKRGDKAAVQTHLGDLMRYGLAPANPDVTIEVVPLLREAGREAEAKQMFTNSFDALKAKLDQDPDSPVPRNNLAWLCARCGEKKLEALAWAKEASGIIPDNYAYMDTLAETHLINGNAAEAVRIEKIVVRLRPGDVFLEKQLARFEAAAKAGK